MNRRFNLPLLLGILLILTGSLILGVSEFLAARNRVQAAETADVLLSLLPPAHQGIPENHSSPDMPVLELAGTDYVAVLQVPAFGVSLPIEGRWGDGRLSAAPRRYTGSAYDGSLVLGGSPAGGQFDFCSRLDLGDRITLTDMAGAQFAYEVRRIDRRSQAGRYELTEDGFDLVLFVPDTDGRGYILVRCHLVPGM